MEFVQRRSCEAPHESTARKLSFQSDVRCEQPPTVQILELSFWSNSCTLSKSKQKQETPTFLFFIHLQGDCNLLEAVMARNLFEIMSELKYHSDIIVSTHDVELKSSHVKCGIMNICFNVSRWTRNPHSVRFGGGALSVGGRLSVLQDGRDCCNTNSRCAHLVVEHVSYKIIV